VRYETSLNPFFTFYVLRFISHVKVPYEPCSGLAYNLKITTALRLFQNSSKLALPCHP